MMFLSFVCCVVCSSFGAAIFEYDPSTDQSTLFSIGMNRVVPLGNSTLHGEMVAIQYDQKKIQNFSFSTASCREVGKEYWYVICENGPSERFHC